MALENLFATEPTLPNVQKTKLPENPDKWAETLTTFVREQFPDIAKLPISVEFKKKDEQAGTAIGAVHVVSLEADKSVYVPFVIDKFQLSPMDVWMEKQTQAVHPLTKDTFKEEFFVHNFAEGLDKRPSDALGQYFNDPSMWTTTYPPLQGRYSYASAGYTILDQIADTMTEEDLNSFKQELKSSPLLLKKFAHNGHEELIKKLAAKKSTVMTNDFGASAAKLIPVSAVSVKREGYDKYSILSASEGLFDLASSKKHYTRGECEKAISAIIGKPQDFLNEVDENGEKMAILKPAPTEGVWLYDKTEKGPVSADQFAAYQVKNKNGLLIKAVVIPDVVNMQGKRVKGKLVLSDTHSCFQDNVAGLELTDSDIMKKTLRNHAVRTGQTGVFVHIGQNGKAISTIPVTIKAIENDHMYDVVDLNGNEMRIRRGWNAEFRTEPEMSNGSIHPAGEKVTATLQSLGFVEVKKGHYVLPEHMHWVPMEPMTEVMQTPQKWMEKIASEKMDMDPVQVLYTGIVYEFTGNGLPKLAHEDRAARLMLANLGVTQEKIASVMDKCRRLGKVKLHKTASLKSSSLVGVDAKATYEKVASACKSLKALLIKEASELDDKATVDVVLSLNFLNADNLSKFVSYLPIFVAAADKLAELTLASRLGLKQVNETAATTCMSKVLEVIDGLKKIEGSMKKSTMKVG